MALSQPARNQGIISVPPDTAVLLRRFGLDPDHQTFFFIYLGQNITLEEFCKKSAADQLAILTNGSVFIA